MRTVFYCFTPKANLLQRDLLKRRNQSEPQRVLETTPEVERETKGTKTPNKMEETNMNPKGGRPRYQTGCILRRGDWWVVRYYVDRAEAGGVTRVRVTHRLVKYDNTYRTESSVRELANEHLRRMSINTGSSGEDSALTFGEYVEKRYFPHCEARLKMSGELKMEPSTLKGYRDIWKFRVKTDAVTKIPMREFRTADAQAFLNRLDHNLSHQSHLRVKSFLSGVFSQAKQAGVLDGANPMNDTKAGGKSSTDFEAYAYSLTEIKNMVKHPDLPDEAKVVMAVAAFTGLRASELRGLQWGDYDGKTITVNRKVWGRHVGEPKTEGSKEGVPVISLLKGILDKFKPAYAMAEDFIFMGEKKGFALNLDNLSRRTIAPILNGGWHGWHGFRRGLGTRLNTLGVNPKTIQAILRHSDVSTTQAYYIITDDRDTQKAMKNYEKKLLAAWRKR
jgi:integrase